MSVHIQPVEPNGLELPFEAMITSGMLWLINTSVFHPRGLALALNFNEQGEATSWGLIGKGDEPYLFDEETSVERFRWAQEFLSGYLNVANP